MDIAEGLTYAKSGFDLLRSAIGLAKDVQGVLPAGEKKDAIGASLENAERQMKMAEAQIAKGLGVPLCSCNWPPTPMLKVGHYFTPSRVRKEVHSCPICHQNDAAAAWQCTIGPDAGKRMPSPIGAQTVRSKSAAVGSRGSWMAR